MGAQVYLPPTEIKVPELDFSDIKQYAEDCDRYISELRVYVRENRTGKNAGEIIRFPVADGYAEYMVGSMKPLELIHIPLYDAYQYANADLMTAKRVQEMLDNQRAIEKIFPR